MDKNKIILYLLYGVLIIVLGYAVYATGGFGLWKNAETSSSNGGKQAVFLSNGQVYFGELSGMNSQFVILKDIYYLQVQKPLQPKPEDQDQQGKLTLVKLGNEIHGPKDEMKINRDHILFVEDIESDGKVMQAIDDYKTNGSSGSGSSGSEIVPEVEE